MRLKRVTLLAFVLLSTGWDGRAQQPQDPQQPRPDQNDANQLALQSASALPEAPTLGAEAGRPLARKVAMTGQDKDVRSKALDTFGSESLAIAAVSRSHEPPEAPQSGLMSASGNIPSSEDGASVSGLVLDTSGAVVVGAEVTLLEAAGAQRSIKTGADGSFAFTKIPADSYVVNVHADGFHTFKSDRVVLGPRQSYDMPNIVLAIATASAMVTVRPTDEVAAAQIRAEERQRVFGVIPSYFTSYVYDAAPLTARQKFSLTAHDTFDPVSFVGVGMRAGIEQASNTFPGYGHGAAGYGKRYAAALGDSLTSDFLGHAVFPSLLHQDPRYFYQGSGSVKSRLYHAISFAVFTRGDKGGLTPNYSYLLGDLGSGALSNLYYPHADRGAGLVFTNAAIGIGGRAAGSVFREFFAKRITTNVPGNGKP